MSTNAMNAESLPVQEGDIAVPGAVLHYRLTGSPTASHVVVFENGWSGSHPYAAWLEQSLAPHVRVLTYDRAGVGYSVSSELPTPLKMTQHLLALLSKLGINQPVIMAGHSYGGLIAALHAVQAPSMVSKVVQLDPTPEFEDKIIDPTLTIVPTVGRILQLCMLLQLDTVVYSEFLRELPADSYKRLMPGTVWQLKSMNGAIREIHLLQAIRDIITASPISAQVPRLVVTAARSLKNPKGVQKLFANEQKDQAFRDAARAIHQRQASLNSSSRWMALPYSHVGLIVNRESAAQVAEAILEFI